METNAPVHANHLIHESSPYLLQHAHNPVNWYPWGKEALQAAKERDMPILVSIGYAACHWCHVMEKESFENEETARIMNDHFICIKIDREERPDLDHIYMDAVQAMTGAGGWPLNVFLTPAGKPFYGGTYFPPQRAFNRPSWTEVLLAISQAFREKRTEMDAQADNLTAHLLKSNSFGLQMPGPGTVFSIDKIEEVFRNTVNAADKEWGGFGKAPKFPHTFNIQFLLRYYFVNRNQEALELALLSLDRMIEGGIYDQVGGGFARYSTDTEWLVPHFEKMLYDNALLIAVLSEAWQLTREERYRQAIDETMNFIQRELQHPQGGFYASLDADSEGEEGKFYVWQKGEIEKLMGEDAGIFCRYFDITEKGNWEGKNILRVRMPLKQFASSEGIGKEKLEAVITGGKKKLLEERSKRVRPLLDDKVILGWNALMNTACSKAYIATGNETYRQMAVKNMQFIFEKFSRDNSNELYHTWKDGQAKYPAFLDDYAFLVQALLNLQEITSDSLWLDWSFGIAAAVIDRFSEQETGLFYYTPAGQEDVIIRKKEVYDGAVPSGNSVMAYNLYQLSFFFDRPDWRERSRQMVATLGRVITGYPVSFGNWACLFQEFLDTTLEIAIIGPGQEKIRSELYEEYLPHRVLQSSVSENQQFPLLRAKGVKDKPLIFLCRDYVCQQPVETVSRFMSLINRPENDL